MSLDKRVLDAINEAVKDLGETPALAQKISAWLESIASGNARLDDRDSTDRHLELLYDNVLSGDEEEQLGE